MAVVQAAAVEVGQEPPEARSSSTYPEAPARAFQDTRKRPFVLGFGVAESWPDARSTTTVFSAVTGPQPALLQALAR